MAKPVAKGMGKKVPCPKRGTAVARGEGRKPRGQSKKGRK